MSISPRACVIGWPIGHSRSPLIHNYWLQQYGIAGSYEKLAVSPEELACFADGIRKGVYVGCNVTLPHKEAIIFFLDWVDDTARAVGAVNTIWLENDVLHGGNTDVEGFLANLDGCAPDWDKPPLRAIVLGAGGASRAIAYGLKLRGAEQIVIVNRSRQRAEEIVRDIGAPISAATWSEVPDLLDSATLLVNATSLGMDGKDALAIDLTPLRSGAVVSDIVYVPLRTPLIKDAEAKGHRTVDGLGMLLHQAVPGFEKWFGVRPEVTSDLRALIEADIPIKAKA